MTILNAIIDVPYYTGLLSWDLLLTLGNLVRFSRPVGEVTPAGQPGYGGYWPEYRPPQEGDSRSACPGLNAMANHGIISRNGRDIKFAEVLKQIRATYNFSPTFCHLMCHYAARMLNRSSRDTFNLAEISLHNGIEHDASLTRLDTALQPNQAAPHLPYVEEFFTFATGKDAGGDARFTIKDLSRILGKRRVESKATNGNYSFGLVQRILSSANTTTILSIFGGRVDDVRAFLLEERIPQGWESRARKPYGLTLFRHNLTAFLVALGIREADWVADVQAENEVTEETS